MSQDEEAAAYFGAMSLEQLDKWLAGADSKNHPQYQRALLRKQRLEQERDHQISERRHVETIQAARKPDPWTKAQTIGTWAAVAVGILGLSWIRSCYLESQHATPEGASPTPSPTTQQPISASVVPEADTSISTPSPQPTATELPSTPASPTPKP